MSVTNINTRSTLEVARELRAAMQGRVVLRGDDDYAQTRQIWNGAVEHQPSMFAVCETAADVPTAVRIALEHEIPLSVRCGGHDWVGRSLRHQGVLVDSAEGCLSPC
jgi:FAD/FMN-containing dehydrogenase